MNVLEALAQIRTMIEASNPTAILLAVPVRNELSRTRYFKRVKGRRSESLRMRSRKRKLSR